MHVYILGSFYERYLYFSILLFNKTLQKFPKFNKVTFTHAYTHEIGIKIVFLNSEFQLKKYLNNLNFILTHPIQQVSCERRWCVPKGARISEICRIFFTHAVRLGFLLQSRHVALLFRKQRSHPCIKIHSLCLRNSLSSSARIALAVDCYYLV